MSSYIPYTQEERDRAHHTDLTALLRSQGEVLKRSGTEYEWRVGGQKVTIRGHLWYHQYEQVGGDAVGFVCRFYGKRYPEALQFLLSQEHCGQLLIPPTPEKEFILPAANPTMQRAMAYLQNRRGIDREVLAAFVRRKMIYESKEHHNVVFVGYDMAGTPRHAHKRGTGGSFKGNAAGSVPEYSFHWLGQSDQIYLFEAPIDLLSYLTLHKAGWQKHSYAAACSVSDKVLFQCLRDAPQLSQIFLCLDSDNAGQNAAKRIQEKLKSENREAELLVPPRKDWNEEFCMKGAYRNERHPNFAVGHGHYGRRAGRHYSADAELQPERHQIQNRMRRPAWYCPMGDQSGDPAYLPSNTLYAPAVAGAGRGRDAAGTAAGHCGRLCGQR